MASDNRKRKLGKEFVNPARTSDVRPFDLSAPLSGPAIYIPGVGTYLKPLPIKQEQLDLMISQAKQRHEEFKR